MKRPGLIEQADGSSRSGYHKFLKKKKIRQERKYAREMLKNGDTPVDSYGKYRGWET